MPRKTSPGSLLAFFSAAACVAWAFAAAGCTEPPNDELTKGIVTGEKQVALAGTGTFFGGSLTAKVTVSRGIGQGLARGNRHSEGAGDTERQEEQRKTYDDYTDNNSKQLLGNPMPPVTLHLIITNSGTTPFTVKINDFESELGNFAVDPEILVIAPGQSAEPTPMVSNLGVSSDDIPFTVTLSAYGDKETRTIDALSRAMPAAP